MNNRKSIATLCLFLALTVLLTGCAFLTLLDDTAARNSGTKDTVTTRTPNIKSKDQIVKLASGYHLTLALRSDGTVVSPNAEETEKEFDEEEIISFSTISNWKGIVDIACGLSYVAGLQNDGTIIYAGELDNYKQSDWTDIVKIFGSSNEDGLAGIKSNGSVVSINLPTKSCNTKSWNDIVSIDMGYAHMVGLKSDGTVVATGDNEYHQCDVEDWRDIKSVSCGADFTVGVKNDGTVVYTGYIEADEQEEIENNINSWTDINSVAVYECGYTFGLTNSGKVLSAQNSIYGEVPSSTADLSSWKNVIQLTCGSYHFLGLSDSGEVYDLGASGCNCVDSLNKK